MPLPSASDQHGLADDLSRTKIYRDYESAFERATGLPLQIRSLGDDCSPPKPAREGDLFCALMARNNQGCAACQQMQKQLEAEVGSEPTTLKCFAGLCESAVPVRVGESIVAFLQTGQVLLERPDRRTFSALAKTILSWGTEIDVKRAEDAYFNTRVISPEHYESIIDLLKVFAVHLSGCAEGLMLHREQAEPAPVARARQFILERSDDDLSLTKVAETVNTSATYFSELFKRTVGMNFTEYVSRVRIEKAKHLLMNPQRRITEVAFDVGFQSLSQFNRAFKRYAGASPRDYRSAQTGA
ncbi:MAG: helix-turn-helix domain-containing protein [Chthoniobacterales bacterium]